MTSRYQWHPSHRSDLRKVSRKLGVLAVALLALLVFPAPAAFGGMAGYEPLHTVLETLSIVVAGLIFAAIWSAPQGKLPGNMIILACAFAGVGVLDVSHMLSFQGMPDFVSPASTEKAINFWLAARSLAAAALLAVAVTAWRPLESTLNRNLILAAVLILVAVFHWLFLFHPAMMPSTFIVGQGLTAFKVGAEYTLIGLNVVTVLALLWRMREPLTFNAASMCGAVVAMGMSEFLFTRYAEVTDLFNVAGHLFKVASYLFLYRAVFVAAIKQPYVELSAMQHQLKATLAAVPDLILEFDLDGRCHNFHSSPNTLLETKPEQYLGRTPHELLSPDSAAVFMQSLNEAQDKGLSTGRQFSVDLRRGKLWFELSVARKAVAPGESARLVALMRDITESKAAVERLRVSEANLAITLHSIGDAVIATDAAGLITRMNETAERLTGWSHGDARGQPLTELFKIVNAASREPLTSPVQLAVQRGDVVGLANHTLLLSRDGREYHISDSAAPMRDADGTIVGAVLVFSDITRQYKAQEAIRAARDRLAAVIDASMDAIIAVDAEQRIVIFSRAAEKMLRLSADEALGESIDRFILPPSRDAHRVHMQNFMRGGVTTRPMGKSAQMCALRADGTAFPAEASISSMQAGNERLYMVMLRDLTEQMRVAASLHDSEERFRTLIEWSPEAVLVYRHARLLYVNPVALKLFGATAVGDLVGKPVLDLIHPDFHYIVRERIRLMEESGAGRTPLASVSMLRGDGTVFDMEIQSTAITFDGKPAVHVVGRDITERRRAEAAHASLEAQLRESQKMQAIGTLAGGIAHDFNNILANILGNAELARQDTGADSPARESVEEIRKAATRARALVQQILSFSRRQPVERKCIALAPVIDESARLLRATLPARFLLETCCDDDVPPVLADATQIEQVVINLVTNAMQAMPGGPGRIGISLDTVTVDAAFAGGHPALHALFRDHPGRTVRLTVSDEGKGMDAATLARIFEPFFTTKPVDEGTGLGLSVVHGIVLAHEGAIEVASKPGEGTTFTIYLPAAQMVADMPAQGGAVSATAPHDAPGGQRILYIDDDESLVFLIDRLLQRRGFRISGHVDARAALEALRADPAGFDLVVTDYNMPGMSGLDVAREVRAIRADLPVAVVSGFIDETLRAQAGEAGVRELVFKASELNELCDAFARLAQAEGGPAIA